MREILFKAKRIDNGEWIEGLVTKIENAFCLIRGYGSNISYECDVNTLCQYTGLTDKNGNKIWENDVLLQKTTERHWCQWECMGIVKYGEYNWNLSDYGYTSIGFYVEPIVKKDNTYKIACGINQTDINDEFYPIEVIGNIFDNPELKEGINNE